MPCPHWALEEELGLKKWEKKASLEGESYVSTGLENRACLRDGSQVVWLEPSRLARKHWTVSWKVCENQARHFWLV